MKKTVKDGSLYFHQKDIMRPLGATLLILGILWYWLGRTILSYLCPIVMIPLGFILFIVGSSKTITDGDIQKLINIAMTDYENTVTEQPDHERVLLRHPAPAEIAAYDFGKAAGMFKKGKNNTPISDRYTAAKIFFVKGGLRIAVRHLSLSALRAEDPTAGTESTCVPIPFSALHAAALAEHETKITLTNSKKEQAVKWCELVFAGEGGDILRLPIKNDMDAVNLVDEINHAKTHA